MFYLCISLFVSPREGKHVTSWKTRNYSEATLFKPCWLLIGSSTGVLYVMTLPLLSSCFMHARLLSPSLHIWKSLWHHHRPMKYMKSLFRTNFLSTILVGQTPWTSLLPMVFSTHDQAIGPPTCGRSWTRWLECLNWRLCVHVGLSGSSPTTSCFIFFIYTFFIGS